MFANLCIICWKMKKYALHVRYLFVFPRFVFVVEGSDISFLRNKCEVGHRKAMKLV